MADDKIGVIGLGYIGQPLVVALAKVGYKAVGMDIDKSKIARFKATYAPDIYEPGLKETLKRYRKSIEFTADYKFLMDECRTIIITVGTPLKNNGTTNHDYLNAAVCGMGRHLKIGHVIILKSTVPLGTTVKVSRKLAGISGLEAGRDFYVGFCPERTIEGMALHELYALPKIVGGINPRSTDIIASAVGKLGGKVIKASSPEIAEMCKLTDNMYRSLNIAFANELGRLCEKMKIDSYEVTKAVNDAYHRTHIYKAGLGADGPCLIKDPLMLTNCAKKMKVGLPVVDVVIKENRYSTLRIAAMVSKWLKCRKIPKPKISFLGLAFKGFPETDDVRGSPAVAIHEKLKDELRNFEAVFYDPIIKVFLRQSVAPSIKECVRNSHILLFLTNNPAIMNVEAWEIIKYAKRPLLVVDCWHNTKGWKDAGRDKRITVFRIGAGTG